MDRWDGATQKAQGIGLASLLALAITGPSFACTNRDCPPSTQPALRYFGYALVDCGHDDPGDFSAQTNYVAEVAAFTNVAQMCVYAPGENIESRLRLMSSSGVGALLSVQAILFAGTPDPAQGSGMKFSLHPEYQERWKQFVVTNNLLDDSTSIAAFYIVDEPVWNGVSPEDLKLASEVVKASFPLIPTAIVEAPDAIAALQVPTSIDWIGFDHYAVPDPQSDPTFSAELALLKSMRSRHSQRILLVMDAQWLPFYGDAGYADSAMGAVAARYYDLARADPEIIGIIGYLWPGGLDDPRQKGARNLPQNVIDEHQRIGRAITGKGPGN